MPDKATTEKTIRALLAVIITRPRLLAALNTVIDFTPGDHSALKAQVSQALPTKINRPNQLIPAMNMIVDGLYPGNNSVVKGKIANAMGRVLNKQKLCAAMDLIIEYAPNLAVLNPPFLISVPLISGTAQSGKTLSASTGTWGNNPTAYAYQWWKNDVAITGATSSTLLLTTALAGLTVKVQVKATNADGSVTATSLPTAVITIPPPLAPENTAAPVITGTPRVGQTLTTSNGSWNYSPTSYAYQWYAGGAVIFGATSSSYTPVMGDAGQPLTVSVTASNAAGSGYILSAPTGNVFASIASVFNLGMNLSGMEYRLPGNSGPVVLAPSSQQIAYFVSKGFTRFRLPINWLSIQPTLNGDLDANYKQAVHDAIATIKNAGGAVRLDIHNFGAGPGGQVGNGTVTTAHFADLWTKITLEYAAELSSGAIHSFDLMNEWSNMPDNTVVFDANQAAITAIRAAGATCILYIEGNNYSGAWNWTADATNNRLWQLQDPLYKLIFSAHCYLDRDSSGTHFVYSTEANYTGTDVAIATTNPNIGVQRITVFRDWCALHNVGGDIGEIGTSNDSSTANPPGADNYQAWNTALDNALAFCQTNNIEVMYWGGGVGFGPSYPFSPEPSSVANPRALDYSVYGVQATQMTTLQKYTGYTGAQPTAYSLTGPASTQVAPGATSAPFVLRYGGKITSAVTITPNDNGAGGSFTPSAISLPVGDNAVASFTYTGPATPLTTRDDVTNNAGWINPPGVLFTTETDLFAGVATPQNIISDIKLYARYNGPCRQLRRNSDGAIADFGFANDALGQANVGKVLDKAAIASWAPEGATTVKRYSQEPQGNHLGPVANPDAPASTPSDYPAYMVDTDGFPSDSFVNSRMDMPSYLHGSTGQSIIAVYNYTSGQVLLNWDFISAIQFGPSHYMYTNAQQDHPVNEQGSMSLGTAVGEYHVYAGTWEANKTDGWRTWRDGQQIGKNRTYATDLTADYQRNVAHLGYEVFGGFSVSFKNRDWIIWNQSVPDSASLAIQNYLKNYYSTVQPTSVAWDIVLDFVNGVYTVDGAASTLNAVTSGSRNIDANGLVADFTTSLAGVPMAALSGTAYTIEVELGQGPVTPSNNAEIFRLAVGSKLMDFYVSAGFVVSTGLGGGAAGGTQSYNLETRNLSTTQRFALTRSPTAWSTVANGAGYATTAAALEPGWTSCTFGNNFFNGRVHHVKIKRATSGILALLNETDVAGTPGTFLPAWLPGANESGPEGGGGVIWPNDASFTYYHNRGTRVSRLPFQWARLQPSLNGALDPTHLSNFDHIVSLVTGAGDVLILDCHSYGQHETYGYIGGSTVTSAHLANMFGKLAARYASNSKVGFDIMNEPDGPLTRAQWYSVCKDSIAAIRASSSTGLILVPSYGGSSNALRFMVDGNAEALVAAAISDSNWALTVHRYLDSTGAGNTNDYAGRYSGLAGLRPVTRWCRTNGVRYFVGETGAAKSPGFPLQCTEYFDQLAYMYANRDVALGYTAWGGGAIGDGDPLCLEPYNAAVRGPGAYAVTPYGERPQMGVMRMFP